MECNAIYLLHSFWQGRNISRVRVNNYSLIKYSLIYHFHFLRECFGEGLQWAGCVIMTLLGQQKRFEALDFSYHLIRVNEVDGQEGAIQGHVSLTIVIDCVYMYSVHVCMYVMYACVCVCTCMYVCTM